MKIGKNIQGYLKVQANLDAKVPSLRNGSNEEKHFELHYESSDKVVLLLHISEIQINCIDLPTLINTLKNKQSHTLILIMMHAKNS